MTRNVWFCLWFRSRFKWKKNEVHVHEKQLLFSVLQLWIKKICRQLINVKMPNFGYFWKLSQSVLPCNYTDKKPVSMLMNVIKQCDYCLSLSLGQPVHSSSLRQHFLRQRKFSWTNFHINQTHYLDSRRKVSFSFWTCFKLALSSTSIVKL